ncbi:MAG TPA: BrxA/BrxB family bacilliredoxin [Brumimicrobium sp.]|nr:BrxA/BrxB family bacilliredoxin [Brumimicrobium sp.]
MYPSELTTPMKEELISLGFEDLTSPEQVDNIVENTKGMLLLVVNSVCGCAAGNMRPGVRQSLMGDIKPDALGTVFAGVDNEATQQARKHFVPFPPSSPSIALFKDGKLVHFLERHHIEGVTADMVAENLMEAYQEFK